MTECDAIVVAVTTDHLWVELPQRATACGSCKSADGCQVGILGLTAGPRRYRLERMCGAQVGDRVSLRIEQGALWHASLMSYLLPVLLAIGGAALGQALDGDGAAMIGMLAGLGLGFALLRSHELRVRRTSGLFSLQPQRKEIRFIQEKS
ncbi:MAG: SoxR reducing system RseC family protein [Rhodocyclales bacterium]|nr:SoxR reducing system RseC family protein [Rhodocyclales bacterium]